jgi:hypothetical protein
MPEYRRTFETPAIVLTRADVEKLETILTEEMKSHYDEFDFSISISAGEARFKGKSIEQLLKQNLPLNIDSLNFKVICRTEDKVRIGGITVSLHRRFGNYEIHSINEVWFKGKAQQLKEFFDLRQPWYGRLEPQIPFMLGSFLSIGIIALLFFIYSKQLIGGLIALSIIGLIPKLYKMHMNGAIFPKTHIVLVDVQKFWTKEIVTIVATVIGAVATVISLILSLLQDNAT